MTGQDLDPRVSASMRRAILHYARKNPGVARSRRQVTSVVATIALLSGVTAAAAAVIVAGIPSQPVPPIANTPTPTVTASPTPTPKPTPTPTEPAIDPTDPSTWTIDFATAGPLALGTVLEDQRALVPDFVDGTNPLCVPGFRYLTAPNGVLLTLVGGVDQPATTSTISFEAELASPEEVRPFTPRTAAGIGIGSTTDELLAAYPDIELTGSYVGLYPYYGITDGAGGWIVFSMSSGDDGVVRGIQIGNESNPPLNNAGVKTRPAERCPA